MPKVVAASEAKSRLGEMLAWVEKNRDTVIVENRGQPKAAIVPYLDYEEFATFKEQRRRQEILARLRKLRMEVQADPRTQNLSTEEAEKIGERFSRDVIEEMAQEGKITFERP